MGNTVPTETEVLEKFSARIEKRLTRQARMYVGAIVREFGNGRFNYEKVMSVVKEIGQFNDLLLRQKEEGASESLDAEIAAMEKRIQTHFPTPTEIEQEVELNRESMFEFITEAAARGVISQVIAELIRTRFDEIVPVVTPKSVAEFLEAASTRAKLITDPRQVIEGEDELMTFDLEQMHTYSLKQLVCLYLKTRLRDEQPGAETMYDPRIKNWTPECERKLQQLLFPKE